MVNRCAISWFFGSCTFVLLIASGIFFGVIHWRREKLRYKDPCEVLASAMGENFLSPKDKAAALMRMQEEPLSVFNLLESDDLEVRRAAAYFIRSGSSSRLPKNELQRLVARIPHDSYEKQSALVSCLSSSGSDETLALTQLFERSQPLSGTLQQQLRYAFSAHGKKSIPRLVEIAADPSYLIENRIAALAVVGNSGDSAKGMLPSLNELALNSSSEISHAASLAALRILDRCDSIRLRADIEWARLHEPSRIPLVLGRIEAANRDLASELMEELRPFGNETGQAAALVLARINYRESIPSLISALRNKSDWRFVAGAAEALGRLKAREAEEALQRVADESVSSVVRRVAKNAILAIHDQYDYSSRHDDVLAAKAVLRASAMPPIPVTPNWWERIWNDYRFSRMREEFRAGWIGLTSPHVDQVQLRSQGGETLVLSFELLPRHRMSFANGIFLGYDEGEFGAGLVYVKKSSPAIYWAISNVTQLVRWRDGVMVITSGASDSIIYFASQDKKGNVSVEPLKRLPGFFERCSVEQNGSLNFYDVIRLNPEGELERIK